LGPDLQGNLTNQVPGIFAGLVPKERGQGRKSECEIIFSEQECERQENGLRVNWSFGPVKLYPFSFASFS